MSASGSIVHHLPPSVDGAYTDMMELLKKGLPITSAYFADNDWIAIGAVKAFKKMGYRIPEDVSIIGFDDVPFCTVIEPSLTTIHVHKHSMGEIAVSRLMKRLHEPNTPPAKIRLGTELVLRHSVRR